MGSEAPPMEETLQALLELLVAPLLPRRISSRETRTSEAQERAVGKQMHAVVLLYNYFHRKQFPELEFLDFETFCKASIIAKSNLLAFMEYDDNQRGQPTIVEKMIKEAFDICNGLNSLTDHPHKEGWPVSKVAVFLVDSNKKNCVLVKDSITQGVWSLIETDVGSSAKLGPVVEDMGKKKPASKLFRGLPYPKQATGSATLDEAKLLESAYSAIKEKAGLDPASLVCLESHYVYSLSQSKTTTRFYLLQSSKGIDGQVGQVPISDVLSGLRGPIVTKVSDGYETTQVIAFFHLFPYEGIISYWFSRQNVPLVETPKNISTLGACKFQTASAIDGSVSQFQNQDKLIRSSETSESFIASANLDTTEDGCKEDHKSQKSEPSLGLSAKPLSVGSVKVPLVKDLFAPTEDQVHDQRRLKEQKQVPDVHGISNSSEYCTKDKFGTTTLEPKQENVEDMSGPLEEVNVDGSAFCIEDGTAKNDLSVVQYQADILKVDSFALVLSTKQGALLQAAMKVLRRKHDNLLHQRKQLWIQQRQLEDAMAICEGDMHTIMKGGDGASALMFETVIEAASSKGEDTVFHQSHATSKDRVCGTKRKRLSEAILSLNNPCEELDEICGHNNWVLPTYTVAPSRGGFVASVMVQGADFNCSANGDMQRKPPEARESAATSMLNKLRSMVHRGQSQ